jgi:transitional endoplasmic reticulum ATPase
MSSSSELAQSAFNKWASHSSRDRVSTELTIQKYLSELHPAYHITRTTPAKCDLLGFAKAGYATSDPDRRDSYDATRLYKAAKLHDEKAELEDDVKFGAWRYTWDSVEFFVYEISYPDLLGRAQKYLFVLSPDTAPTQDGYNSATDRLLLAAGDWTKALHEEIYVFDDSKWTKNKALFKSVQDASWNDVILEPDVKANLLQDVETFFDNRSLYKAMNVPWKRGVIFHGVPGNGKTISIKALINSLAARDPPVPSLYVKSLDGCNGPKWAIQRIFSRARVVSPCLLIFEDLDSLVEDKTRSYFLNEVDGLDSNDGILMIGSTNHLAELDPAITKRPSRFDRKYHFKVPDEKNRLAYCRYWKEKFSGSTTIDFPDEICPLVVKMTDGFSFAYLKELFITSLLGLARGPTEETDSEEQTAASNSSFSSDPVVVEARPASSDGKESDEKRADKVEAEKQKRVMPEVQIPETLQDNKLLQSLKAEAKGLWEQMENLEEEALARKKAAAACPPNPFGFPLPMGQGDDD